MNTSFRAIKGVPRKKQGLVYYAMLNREHSNPKIIKACEKAIEGVCAAEHDKKMLLEYLTTEYSQTYIASAYYCSVEKLLKLYRKYIKLAVENITKIK